MAESSVKESRAWLGRENEALAAAKHLANKSFNSEAMSRAYYAMFYAARALLMFHGILVHKHSAVISAFGKEFANKGLIDPLFHRSFIDAFKERTRVDYVALERSSLEDAQKQIELAERFVREVTQMLPGLGGTIEGT